MEPSVHVSRSDFLGLSQLEVSELFPKVRRSLRTGSHPSVTLTGQTPRWLEEMPRHHLRKTDQHCLNDCSRKLEGDKQLCWPRPPRGEASSRLCLLQETRRWEQLSATSAPLPRREHSGAR